MLYSDVFGKDATKWESQSAKNLVSANRNHPDFLIIASGAGAEGERVEFATDMANSLAQGGAKVLVFDGANYSHREINVGIGTDPVLGAVIIGFLTGNT